MHQSRLTPYLFLFPGLLLLVLTVFYPAFQSFLLSFQEFGYNLTVAPTWVGLSNFVDLKQDPIFWKTLGQTLLYLIVVVPILAIASLLLAILVNQKLPGITWFRGAFYTPVVISMVVAGIAWKAVYNSQGILNQLLGYLGQEPIGWLTDPQLALFSVMVVTIWKGLGYYMVIYLAGLQSLPQELYEAAAIDGADGWQSHLHLTFPLMKPYLFLVSVVSAIAATKVFEEVFILTKGEPNSSSKTIVYYLYEQGFQYGKYNYACAIGLVLFLGILVLSLINLKLSDRYSP
ncbi:MAG: sugar ABC transporter permease [Synechococcaceae cyanobacterium RL_1_2]|nr:sugar ABC transporter permease [Synechococcaceae cyanobacterium RL_1_2]